MKKPKCSTDRIERELSQLEGSGCVCAIAYLKAELKRRKASARNKGATVKHDDLKHQKWRESSRKYRENLKKAEKASIRREMAEIDASAGVEKQERVIVPFEDV